MKTRATLSTLILFLLSLCSGATAQTISGGIDTTGGKSNLQILTGDSDTSAVVSLGQNIPNPVKSITRIPFLLKEAGTVQLLVYDEKGRKVMSHELGAKAGMNTVDLNTSRLPIGNYLYQIRTGITILSRVMTVVK